MDATEPRTEIHPKTPSPMSNISFSPPTKRRRIHLACISCRDRKTRCDGGRPSCASCDRRNKASSCVYDQNASSTRHIAALENRLKRLERVERADWVAQRPSDARNSQAPTEPAEGHDGRSLQLSNAGITAPPLEENLLCSRLSPSVEPPYHIDALATVISPEDDDTCVYGESSTIAFLRQVEQTGRGNESSNLSSKRSTLDNDSSSRDNQSSTLLPLKLPQQSELAVLPIRYRSDRFLACYWDFVHPLFPLLSKTRFTAKYEQIWLPDGNLSTSTEDTVFISNLNLALALGCQFCQDIEPNDRLAMANQFYERSQHVLVYDILGSTSLSVVQWLLLTAVYCQSTNHASRCWNSVGLAIRLAQSLGLHLEHSGREISSQVELEMRRKIWHTCVVLDRLLAMTFGRPVMIGGSYNTQIPSMIDDEFLQETGVGKQPSDVPSRMGLFVSSCSLFEILADILSSFYAVRNDSKFKTRTDIHEMAADVLEFNRRLDKFSVSIPAYLKTSLTSRFVPSDKESHINLQQQVLYCRFLYTRVLSLRPLLVMATQESRNQTQYQAKTSTLDKELVQRCCNLCINTAHCLIEAIHEHLDTLYKSFGWHSVYFIFASATILLASINLKDPTLDFEQGFETSWNRCLRILNHYKEHIQAAPRAIQILETLRRQMRTGQDQSAKQGSQHESLPERSEGNENMIPDPQQDFSAQLDLSQFNFDSTNSLCDAWFSQQVMNLDYMEGL